MAKKMAGPKDPYAKLSPVFKDAITAMSPEEIRERIAQMAIDHNKLMKAKREDKDLAEKKLAVEKLAEKYKDGSNLNTLKFKLLPKENLTGSIKEEITSLALAEVDLQAEKDDDGELKDARDRVSMANETYSASAKMTKLKTKYCKSVLEDKGKA